MDEQARRITEGLPTKAAKIRALHDAGYARAEIARALGLTYQHVRNVLEAPRPAPLLAAEPSTGACGGLPIEDGGVVRLPASLLALLGARPGDRVAFVVEGEDVRLLGRASGLRWAQDVVGSLGDQAGSSALVAQRRSEADDG